MSEVEMPKLQVREYSVRFTDSGTSLKSLGHDSAIVEADSFEIDSSGYLRLYLEGRNVMACACGEWASITEISE